MRVRLFAILRERAGSESIDVELAQGATVADAMRALSQLPALAGVLDRLPVAMAVNREYATAQTRLLEQDELALIPPVSGGADIHVRVTDEPLSLDALTRSVTRPTAGAIVTFQGMPRDVSRLDYEAYREMAEAQIAAILGDCMERHDLHAAAAEHRVGRGRALRAERDRRRVGRPPLRGLRRREGGDRPDQGAGADLEAGSRASTGRCARSRGRRRMPTSARRQRGRAER